jgi:2-dehydro-3-deoxyphosphooctonate aldolase (KDO 8-P synthase)
VSADSNAGPFVRDGSFFLIAGPCVLESPELNLQVAKQVREVAERLGIRAIFKASFDKANRTSLASARGPGIEPGLAELARIRSETGLPVLTDVHEAAQVPAAAAVVDVLQIPAFLCRQTDLLVAAGASGLPVNIKKGQWLAPEDMQHPVAKVRESGGKSVAVTERGTAFGYGRWVVDMRSFMLMREACNCPTIFDATHSVQLPGQGGDVTAGAGTASGGEPRFVGTLARAAIAAGADGIFVETHPDPQAALSDGANMLLLDELEPLLTSLLAVRAAARDAKEES